MTLTKMANEISQAMVVLGPEIVSITCQLFLSVDDTAKKTGITTK